MRIVSLLFMTIFGGQIDAACKISDIEIKNIRANFVDECIDLGSKCMRMKGIATLTNNCSESIGVEVKITAYDKSGVAVSTTERWPASIKNIAVGDYPFSLEGRLEYAPGIEDINITVISVRKWDDK